MTADATTALFALLAKLRGANADSLFALHFKTRGVPYRTMMRRLAAHVARRELARTRLRGSRSIYRLTSTSLATVPSATETPRRPPPERQAAYCWLRSSLWAAFAEQGYIVSRGNDAVHALRRWLVDRAVARFRASRRDDLFEEFTLRALREHPQLQLACTRVCACGFESAIASAPRTCPRCRAATKQRVCRQLVRCDACKLVAELAPARHRRPLGEDWCPGSWVPLERLPFDVAFKRLDTAFDVVVVFVDNPSRPLIAQLAELPLCIAGQPRLPILIRSVDPDSRFHTKSGRWLAIGRRHRALLHAFRSPMIDAGDPGFSAAGDIASTAFVVDPHPSVHVHGY